MEDRRSNEIRIHTQPLAIAVIGGSMCDEEDYAIAYQVGTEIAKRGAILICGGRGGVMDAACRGARDEGGLTIGILPGNTKEEANPHVVIPIITNTGMARNYAVVNSAAGIVAVGGEFGTLSEIAFALKSSKHVVGIGSWEMSKQGMNMSYYYKAIGPKEALDILFRKLGFLQ